MSDFKRYFQQTLEKRREQQGRIQRRQPEPDPQVHTEEFEKAWRLLRGCVSPLGSAEQGEAALRRIEALLDTLRRQLVSEMRGALRKQLPEGRAPPCTEFMLKEDLPLWLCQLAKDNNPPGVTVLVLNYFADLLLFSATARPLLGYYKQVVEPLIDLLRHVAPAEGSSAPLRHGVVNLAYALTWQLSHSVQCTEFFLVYLRRPPAANADDIFADVAPPPAQPPFILLEILMGFVAPRSAVDGEVRAGEVSGGDVGPHSADGQHTIAFSDVAVDALGLLLCLPSASVAEAVGARAVEIAGALALQAAAAASLLAAQIPPSPELAAAAAERLRRRTAVLGVAARHASAELRAAAVAQFDARVFRGVLLHAIPRGPPGALAAAEHLLHAAPLSPLTDALAELLLGTGPEGPAVRDALLDAAVSNDEARACAALQLYSQLLRARPLEAYSSLISPWLPACEELTHRSELRRCVDLLFHPSVAAGRRVCRAALTDAHAEQMRIRLSAQQERYRRASSPHRARTDGSSAAHRRGTGLLRAGALRLSSCFDQGEAATLAAMELLSTMLHLDRPPLMQHLLVTQGDLSLPPVLLALRSNLDDVDRAPDRCGFGASMPTDGVGPLELAADYARRGVMSPVSRAASEDPAAGGVPTRRRSSGSLSWRPSSGRRQLVTTAATLDEWRLELHAVLSALAHFDCADCIGQALDGAEDSEGAPRVCPSPPRRPPPHFNPAAMAPRTLRRGGPHGSPRHAEQRSASPRADGDFGGGLQGWLQKRGDGLMGGWNRRWCAIRRGMPQVAHTGEQLVDYFIWADSMEQMIDAQRHISSGVRWPKCVQLGDLELAPRLPTDKVGEFRLHVRSQHGKQPMRFIAANSVERDHWLSALGFSAQTV
eukprot:TRINITY_DN25768_c0_g1_i1.p1 TRINITY_DN25768_c0_g1~~TRINITY_DN25768_c0_g1_i1.p1  ORF type:complete len:917 (+),score=253.08 TRINITY_DN25768_c0_g1_i1:101-2752(+)